VFSLIFDIPALVAGRKGSFQAAPNPLDGDFKALLPAILPGNATVRQLLARLGGGRRLKTAAPYRN